MSSVKCLDDYGIYPVKYLGSYFCCGSQTNQRFLKSLAEIKLKCQKNISWLKYKYCKNLNKKTYNVHWSSINGSMSVVWQYNVSTWKGHYSGRQKLKRFSNHWFHVLREIKIKKYETNRKCRDLTLCTCFDFSHGTPPHTHRRCDHVSPSNLSVKFATGGDLAASPSC